MAEIFEFKIPEKPKLESVASAEKKIDAKADYNWKLPSKMEEHEFIMKFSWVVDIVHMLKRANRNAVSREDVRIRRELVRGSSPDELVETVMKAEESEIKQHPAYYDAVTDEIMERNLNKSRYK